MITVQPKISLMQFYGLHNPPLQCGVVVCVSVFTYGTFHDYPSLCQALKELEKEREQFEQYKREEVEKMKAYYEEEAKKLKLVGLHYSHNGWLSFPDLYAVSSSVVAEFVGCVGACVGGGGCLCMCAYVHEHTCTGTLCTLSLRKERKLLDLFKEAASNRPDKKEREEIESLRSEVCVEWYLCNAWYYQVCMHKYRVLLN